MFALKRIALSLLLFAGSADASKPVERTLTGCVIDGIFYSVDGRAYRINVADVDLAPLEGKGVSMRGWLSPGDAFRLEKGVQPEVKQAVCPSPSLRLIKRDIAIDLRVNATAAAQAGAFDRATELIGRALAVVTPPDCDTITDRAHILTLKGELALVGKDLDTLEAKRCFVEARMNPLLLHELGKGLLAKGDKPKALRALQLALAACDGDWCRPNIARDLQAAKK